MAGLGDLDELRRLGDVVDVAGGEVDVKGITETVHESVGLGGRASARASSTLTLGPRGVLIRDQRRR
jgi:hypothetical protein